MRWDTYHCKSAIRSGTQNYWPLASDTIFLHLYPLNTWSSHQDDPQKNHKHQCWSLESPQTPRLVRKWVGHLEQQKSISWQKLIEVMVFLVKGYWNSKVTRYLPDFRKQSWLHRCHFIPFPLLSLSVGHQPYLSPGSSQSLTQWW